MSEFNAGSIVGTLDLDRSPFERGLDEARRQADEFSQRSHTTTLDVDTRVAAAELERFEERLRAIRNPTVHPDVDTRVAAAELEALERRIREVTRDRTIIIRTVNTGGAGGPGGSGGSGGSIAREAEQDGNALSFLWSKAGLLSQGLLSILPALVPLTGAATGFGLAMASGMTMAAIAIGSFALVAKSDLTDVQTALKAVGGDATKLPAQLQPLGAAIEQLHFAFAALKNQTFGAVSGALTQGIHTLIAGMSGLAPVINATGHGLQMMFAIFQNFVQGPTFKNFLDLTRREAGPALTALGVILVNVLTGALRLFQVFTPLLEGMGRSVEKLSGQFASWTQGNGFSRFVQGIYRDIVLVEPLLRQLGQLVLTVWHALSGGGTDSVQFLTVVIGALNQMAPALHAIVQLVSPFEHLIEAVLPVVAPIINELGKAAEQLLPIVNALIGLFAQGLTAALQIVMPLLEAFDQDIIVPLVPVIMQLVKAFEPLITTVFQALKPLIPPLNELFKALGDALVIIAKALLPLVPIFIELTKDALVPLIPTLVFLVKLLADILHWIQPLLPFLTAAVAIFAAMGSPILLVIGVLGGLVWIVKEIIKHWQGFLDFWKGLWGTVQRFFTTAWRDIKGAWDATGRFFQRIWADIYGFFKHYGALILLVLVPIIGLPLLIAQHWDQLVGWLKKTWDHIWADITGAWGAIERFFKALPGRIVGYFSDALTWLLHAGRDIIQGLWNGIQAVWAIVIGFYTKVYSVILGFFATAATWLIHAGQSIITGLWNGIKIVWATVVGFFLSVGSAVINFFAGAVGWLVNAGERIFTGLWNGIKVSWSFITSFLGGLPGAVMGFFSGAIGWLEGVGEDILNGLWNGLKRIWNDLTGWISDIAGQIGGIFKKILGIFSPSRVMMGIGVYTMQGLHIGLRDTFEGQIRPYLARVAGDISGAFGGAGFDGHTSLTTAATVAVQTGQTAQTAALLSKVDDLVKAVQQVPGATGTAVGSAVGNIEKATAKQTRDLVTAGRTA